MRYLAVLVLAFTVSGARAASVTNTFTVLAEAKGMVRADYEIGATTLTFTSEPDAGFRVSGSGRVAHPLDAAAIYEYQLDMHFRLRGDKLEIVSSHNTSNAAGKDILAKIENIMPFAYLSRVLPRKPGGYALGTRNGTYTVSYAGNEVSVAHEGGEVGRFFIQPRAQGMADLPRFRIIRHNGANLMFVAR